MTFDEYRKACLDEEFADRLRIQEARCYYVGLSDEYTATERAIEQCHEDIHRNLQETASYCAHCGEYFLTEELYSGLIEKLRLEREMLYNKLERLEEDLAILMM